MVRVEGSNRNINRLNKTWHCAGTEDFECQASGGSTAGSVEEGFVLDEACMAVRPCPPDGTDGRPKDPPTVVPGIVLGLGCVGLDVPVTMPTMLGNTPRHHRHRWLYSALDVDRIAVAEQNQHEMKFVEEEEWGTCMSVVPFVCFNIVQFHHVDRVKRQFNGEQPVPGAPVNLDSKAVKVPNQNGKTLALGSLPPPSLGSQHFRFFLFPLSGTQVARHVVLILTGFSVRGLEQLAVGSLLAVVSALAIISPVATVSPSKVEHIIREQNIWEAYEILELFYEFILACVPIIERQKGKGDKDKLKSTAIHCLCREEKDVTFGEMEFENA
ncbi:hypothetical protein Ahy_B03g063381 [Arachis hypogaea]|uniref:Uncharacterized protein n=1 Tax=Arachis hypogaea TaxID=3818 RepID=A0A444ZX20_ARAHY|nr:hypothetical protein Ahy_B03g063381 [Arachis hypogaea]